MSSGSPSRGMPRDMPVERIVVVGASLAGGRVAEQLRRGGFEGELLVVGAEPHRPYDRPPLSKKMLEGGQTPESLYFRSAEWYAERKIDLVLGTRAVGLDARARSVALSDGRALSWDRLVIATGADVRRLRGPGADLRGIHYVRTLEDALAIQAALHPGARAVILGAGVIGMEVAATARGRGAEVTVLEIVPRPLARAFGAAVGDLYAEVHRDHGVDLRCGVAVDAILGTGRVEEVVLVGGERIAADLLIAGIGVTPATAWLAGSDIALAPDGGVLTDDHGRTNVEGVYAAGDVATFFDPREGRPMRVESVDHAQSQAQVVASNLVGKDEVYAPVPFFWSDQYDLKLQSVGHVGPYDEVVFRGSVKDRAFVAFHLHEGRLAFAVGVNRLKEIGGAKKLVGSRVPVSRDALADESVSLATLLPAK